MYDVIFSKQWIFDKCMELSIVTPVIFLLLVILFGFTLYKISRKIAQRYRNRLFISLIGTLASIPLIIFFILWTGYVVVGCSGGMFWEPVRNGHIIHNLLKIRKQKLGIYPKNETELMSLDSKSYKQIIQNAKTKYIYDQPSESFTWFIRPSKYYTIVFDSKSEYSMYKIPAVVPINNWDSISGYPPKYEGPWNELPK